MPDWPTSGQPGPAVLHPMQHRHQFHPQPLIQACTHAHRRSSGWHAEGPLSIWSDCRSFSSCCFWSRCSSRSCSRAASVPGVPSARDFCLSWAVLGLLFVIVRTSIECSAYRRLRRAGTRQRATAYASVAQRERFCLSASMPAQGSFLRRLSFAGTSLIVKTSARCSFASSLHASGNATGAPGRPRIE